MSERVAVPRRKAVGFTRLSHGTREDWEFIMEEDARYNATLADRILAHLSLLSGEFSGLRVDRLEHSLQSATRAYRDGRDDEYVVCALLHDIGDTLAPYNHADIAADLLKPFVSERNQWMIRHHAIFQGYYFWDMIGWDGAARERFRANPHFDHTAEFCAEYDENAFDPAYQSMPLEAFAPMVRKLVSVPKSRD